jgi:hypothetical protein
MTNIPIQPNLLKSRDDEDNGGCDTHAFLTLFHLAGSFDAR